MRAWPHCSRQWPRSPARGCPARVASRTASARLPKASRSRPRCMPRSARSSRTPPDGMHPGEHSMPEIVISEFMDEAAIRASFAGRDVLYDPKLVDDPARLGTAVRDARALIVRNRTQVRGALLKAAPRLEVVGRLGVGLDNIDVPACEARGIAVYPATGANDLSVAEYVITAALMLLRRAWLSTARVVAGEWPRTDLMGREMDGKQLGLVGFGAIARETATR